MDIALDLFALLLLLAGLFLCGVNAFIALRNLRAGAERYVSPVPLIPAMFMGVGLALLLRGCAPGTGSFLLPFILLDLSVVSLLLLPLYLFVRLLRGADAPPLLPRLLRRVLLLLYLATMGCLACAAGVGVVSARTAAQAPASLSLSPSSS